ncbi:MAG: hypothetical protein L0H41_01070 [Microlunatus sp.]|nr:hypothetical protein [Microlunatus sp.]
MATWEDGPEYAPLERPDAFAQPPATTLETPPPPIVTPPAPTARPGFENPTVAVPELAGLVPAPPDQRDPNEPFGVVTSNMTAETSAWASAHWTTAQSTGRGDRPGSPATGAPHPGALPPAGAPVFPPPSGTAAFPPPTAHGYPPPGAQPFPLSGPPPASGPFPAPGTDQWFAPGGYPTPPPGRPAPDARTVLAAATPGLLVTLAVGGFIWVLAPITLVLAFLLSGRMTYGRKATRAAFAGVLGLLGLVTLLSLISADGLFSQWWGTLARWACFLSWVTAAAAVLAAYRAVKHGQPDPPRPPRGTFR